MALMRDCGFALLELAPFDYHLFRNRKNNWLRTSIALIIVSYLLLYLFQWL